MAGLTCQDLVELVTDHLEGALGVEATELVEEHLASCTGCETYLRQLVRTAALVAEVGAEGLSEELRQGLLDAWRDLRR